MAKSKERVISMEKVNLGIPDNIIVKIPENCASCENVRIINGKTFCGLPLFIASAKPLEVDISSKTQHSGCPLLKKPISNKSNPQKKWTNADKIRNMSDEELAKFLDGVEGISGESETLEWLRMEVDEP